MGRGGQGERKASSRSPLTERSLLQKQLLRDIISSGKRLCRPSYPVIHRSESWDVSSASDRRDLEEREAKAASVLRSCSQTFVLAKRILAELFRFGETKLNLFFGEVTS
jgi:hypothetical protein